MTTTVDQVYGCNLLECAECPERVKNRKQVRIAETLPYSDSAFYDGVMVIWDYPVTACAGSRHRNFEYHKKWHPEFLEMDKLLLKFANIDYSKL